MFSFARVSTIISTYGRRLVRGLRSVSPCLSIARCGRRGALGDSRNMVIRDRFPVTVATWLLLVVAVIVWNPGIGFFAYGTIKGIGTHFASGLVASNLWILPGRVEDWGRAALGVRAIGGVTEGVGKGGEVVFPYRWFRCGPVAPAKTGVHRSA